MRCAVRGRPAEPVAPVRRPDRAGGIFRPRLRALRDHQHRHRGDDADRGNGRVRGEPVRVRAVARGRDGPGCGRRRQSGRRARGGGRRRSGCWRCCTPSSRFAFGRIRSSAARSSTSLPSAPPATGIASFSRRISRPDPGTFPPFDIPVLADLPALGAVLFSGHKPIAYLVPVFAVAIHVVLFHTPWGLRTRAVGENPRAADTLGVDVIRCGT